MVRKENLQSQIYESIRIRHLLESSRFWSNVYVTNHQFHSLRKPGLLLLLPRLRQHQY